jgi:hypothetical protein
MLTRERVNKGLVTGWILACVLTALNAGTSSTQVAAFIETAVVCGAVLTVFWAAGRHIQQ